MKKIALLVITAAMVSCVSKETYTEKRTLTYPKGQTPHIKEMYLRNGTAVHTERYVGVEQPHNDDPLIAEFPTEWEQNDLPAPQNNNHITIGSTKSEVARIQGTPTRIANNTDNEFWWYGMSYIVFDSQGTVKSWDQNGGALKVAI